MIRKCGKCVIWYAWLEVSLSVFLFLLEIAGCIHNLHQPPSVSLFSTQLLPSFFSLHLLFSLLAIWLLQLCSLAYCKMCRCHPKNDSPSSTLMPFCMYTNYTVDILHSLPNKSRGGGGGARSAFAHVCWGHNGRHLVWCFRKSSLTPLTSSIHQTEVFWHCDGDWWSVFLGNV